MEARREGWILLRQDCGYALLTTSGHKSCTSITEFGEGGWVKEILLPRCAAAWEAGYDVGREMVAHERSNKFWCEFISP